MSALKSNISFEKLCRICLLTEGEFNLSEKVKGKLLSDIFEICSNITVEKHFEFAPYLICSDCISELLKFHAFYMKCQQSNYIIIKTSAELQAKKSKESKGVEEIKEIIQVIDKKHQTLENNEELLEEVIENSQYNSDIEIDEVSDKDLEFNVKYEHSYAEQILEREFKPEHFNSKKFSCEKCQQAFNHLSSLKLHLKLSHTEDIPNDDENKHESENSIENNITDDVSKKHICKYCTLEFDSQKVLKIHLKARHKSSISNKKHIERQKAIHKPTKCMYCGLLFTKLYRHKCLYMMQYLFECPFCEKAFCHQNYQKAHLRKHSKDKIFNCNLCHINFKDSNEFRTHMTEHPGYRPFQCDQCKKGFFLEGRLKKHYLEHTGGLLKCDICGEKNSNIHCKKLAENK